MEFRGYAGYVSNGKINALTRCNFMWGGRGLNRVRFASVTFALVRISIR